MFTMLPAAAETERDLVKRTPVDQVRAKRRTDSGSAVEDDRQQRADTITKYATGESVSRLARRYNLSRGSILGVVNPS